MLDESKSINLHKDIKISKLRAQLHSQRKKQDGQALTNLFTVYEQNFWITWIQLLCKFEYVNKRKQNHSVLLHKHAQY